MSTADFFASLAEASGWLARLQVGGIVVLGSSFLLIPLVARRSLSGRISIRRSAVGTVLLLCGASIVTPWHWSVPPPELVALPGSPFATAPDPWLGDDRPVEPSGTASAGPDEPSVSARDERASRGRSGTGTGNAPDLLRSADDVRTRDVYVGSAVALWAAGAVGILLYLAIGMLTLSRHARRAEDVTGRIRVTGGLRGRPGEVRVLVGGPYRIPICFGLRRGTVLLPRGATDWPREHLRAVVLHELAHIESRDHRSLLPTRLACALCWCNPLVWTLSRALEREADARCDERVVRTGIPASSYARILVELAAEGRRPAIGVAMHLGGRSTLGWRVKRVLKPPPRPAARARSAGEVAAVALLLLVGLACASGRIDAGPEAVASPGDSPHPSAGPPDGGPAWDPPGASVDGAGRPSWMPVRARRPPGSDFQELAEAGGMPVPPGGPTLRIVSAGDANGGRPLAVEVVAALSEQAAAALMGADATAWFSSRSSWERAAGVRTLLAVEIRPGSCLDVEVPEPAGVGPVGLFLFADYANPGQHRARLDWLRSPVLVELGPRGLNASDEAPPGSRCPDPARTALETLRESGEGGDFPPSPSSPASLDDAESGVPEDAEVCRSNGAPAGGRTPTNLRDAVSTLLEHPDAHRREAAARAIPRLMREAPAPPPDPSPGEDAGIIKDHQHALTAAASDPDATVRLAAICALAQVGDGRALEALGWRTAPREPAVIRRAAAWAAARIRARAGPGARPWPPEPPGTSEPAPPWGSSIGHRELPRTIERTRTREVTRTFERELTNPIERQVALTLTVTNEFVRPVTWIHTRTVQRVSGALRDP